MEQGLLAMALMLNAAADQNGSAAPAVAPALGGLTTRLYARPVMAPDAKGKKKMTSKLRDKPSELITTKTRYGFSVHTALLLAEVLNNKGTSILRIPILQLDDLLRQVAARCAELNDAVLDKLMLRLSLYSAADPMSDDYDPRLRVNYLKEDVQALELPEAVDLAVTKAREIYKQSCETHEWEDIDWGKHDDEGAMKLLIEGIKAGMEMKK